MLLLVLGLLFMLMPTVNLVNINVSRIMERASEIGVRKAFGAPARTLVGQFLVENILLTLIGGAIGFVLSIFVLRGIAQSGLFSYAHFTINLRVFAYGMVLAVMFGLISGRLPGVADVAPESGAGAEGRPAMTRHLMRLIWNRKRQNFLLTVEIFFSFLTLFGVVLVAAHYVNNSRQPLGYEIDRVWSVGVDRKESDEDPAVKARHRETYRQLLMALRDLPQVEAVGAAFTGPYANSNWGSGSRLVGGRHVSTTASTGSPTVTPSCSRSRSSKADGSRARTTPPPGRRS